MSRPSLPLRSGQTALALLAVAMLVLGSSACSKVPSSKSTSSTGPTATVTSVPKTTTTAPSQVSTDLYFVRGTILGVALRSIDAGPDPRYLAVQALAAGPSASEVAAGLGTALPAGTTVRGLQIRGGVATINLSPEFVAAGPPASLSARLAQVVYTLTAYPNVGKVSFLVSKLPLTTFAGVNLSAPVGRSQVTASLPGVLLETPAVGASLHGTLRIAGLTSFAGTYDVQLVDDGGRLLASVTNTAVVGATFSQTVPFTTPTSSVGKIQVFARPSTAGQVTQVVSFAIPIGP